MVLPVFYPHAIGNHKQRAKAHAKGGKKRDNKSKNRKGNHESIIKNADSDVLLDDLVGFV